MDTRAFTAIEVVTRETMRHVADAAIALFRDGDLNAIHTWQSAAADTRDVSPADFPTIHAALREKLEHRIVVAHGDNALRALNAACASYRLPRFDCVWLDGLALARLALRRRYESQYRLDALASWLGVDFAPDQTWSRADVIGRSALWCAAILGHAVTSLPLALPEIVLASGTGAEGASRSALSRAASLSIA
jgi:hypothetical protein